MLEVGPRVLLGIGEQLAVVRGYVRKHPAITFVFIDFLCLAQGERTSKDKIDFATMLPNMYLLYGGTSVLVCAISRQYMERFGTQHDQHGYHAD